MAAILLKQIYALKTAADKPVQSGVDLLIREGRVAEIGRSLMPPKGGCRVIDCSRHVVIPGMVNTHHHFYQTLTRNLPAVQNAKLFDWLVYLYDIWKHLDADAVYQSSLLAMGELLKTGCTAASDHHYLYPAGFDGDIMELQFQAADVLGMRFSPARGSMSLGRSAGGLPPDSVVQDERTILKESLQAVERYHDPSPYAMRKIVIAPCSPFSVSKDLMRESVSLARSYGVRLHTHLAETEDENDFCLETYGKRPLELMQECGFVGDDVFYAHGIHFNDEELRLLADTGTGVAHCPSSNMRLGSGICRVREMLDLGVPVSLAVDGSASNDTSDMLGEARQALLLQRIRYGSGGIRADEVFAMASEGGAAALGFDKTGRLEPGYCADAAVFNVESFEYAGTQSDPPAALLFAGFSHRTQYTIVNGRIVVENGTLLGIDEALLYEQGSRAAARLLESAGLGKLQPQA